MHNIEINAQPVVPLNAVSLSAEARLMSCCQWDISQLHTAGQWTLYLTPAHDQCCREEVQAMLDVCSWGKYFLAVHIYFCTIAIFWHDKLGNCELTNLYERHTA